MRGISVLFVLMILIITGCYIQNSMVKEGFISGTDVQLLTSKPYYTWYDYLTNWRRYPYFYRYPYYNYYPQYYNYGWYPYYRPQYY